MEDSLSRTPINRRAKFGAASFILGGEIRNRTNKQNYNKNKQTVNDISTLCLSSCADNEAINECVYQSAVTVDCVEML